MSSTPNPDVKRNIMQVIQTVAPAQIVAQAEVAERFIQLYATMNPTASKRAALQYEAEKFHFMKLFRDKKELQGCTPMSIYGVFLDMAVNGLSFDPAMKHAYVVAMNTNVGTRDNPKWETRATLMISGYGELHMRVQQKQLKYADNPVLVFNGDEFSHGNTGGKSFLEHVAKFPRVQPETVIACYIRLERTDGSVDYKVFSFDQVQKLKAFSKQKESLAWGAGINGMIEAKTIKHAFRSYPKMRMGDFSMLQSNVIDTDGDITPPAHIDYGLEGNVPLPAAEMKLQPETPGLPADQQPAATGSVPQSNDDFADKQPAALAPVKDDEDF